MRELCSLPGEINIGVVMLNSKIALDLNKFPMGLHDDSIINYLILTESVYRPLIISLLKGTWDLKVKNLYKANALLPKCSTINMKDRQFNIDITWGKCLTYRFLMSVAPRKALRGMAWMKFSLRSLLEQMNMLITWCVYDQCIKHANITISIKNKPCMQPQSWDYTSTGTMDLSVF